MLDALLPERSVRQSGWCTVVGVGTSTFISRPTLPKIAVFLLWLRRVRMFSVSAVMGHRSMLSSVFRFKLPEISSSPILQDLFRSFNLRSSTYEPLANLSLRCLTKKVLFLLSLDIANELGNYRRSLGWSRFLIRTLLYHMFRNSWPRWSLPCDPFLAPSWSSLSDFAIG